MNSTDTVPPVADSTKAGPSGAGRNWHWRLVSWFGDLAIVAAALWCARGDAPTAVINVSYWMAALCAFAGLLNLLVGDDKPKDPAWWDGAIRMIPTVAFASIGWWWMCAAWTLNWVGHFTKRERYKRKASSANT